MRGALMLLYAVAAAHAYSFVVWSPNSTSCAGPLAEVLDLPVGLACCSQHAALGYFMLVASGGSSGSGDFQLLRFAPQDTPCVGDAIRGPCAVTLNACIAPGAASCTGSLQPVMVATAEPGQSGGREYDETASTITLSLVAVTFSLGFLFLTVFTVRWTKKLEHPLCGWTKEDEPRCWCCNSFLCGTHSCWSMSRIMLGIVFLGVGVTGLVFLVQGGFRLSFLEGIAEPTMCVVEAHSVVPYRCCVEDCYSRGCSCRRWGTCYYSVVVASCCGRCVVCRPGQRLFVGKFATATQASNFLDSSYSGPTFPCIHRPSDGVVALRTELDDAVTSTIVGVVLTTTSLLYLVWVICFMAFHQRDLNAQAAQKLQRGFEARQADSQRLQREFDAHQAEHDKAVVTSE